MKKYEELRNNILKLIENQNLKPNDQIPSTAQIEKLFNMSTITIRRAISELCKEGVLYRHHGKGVFVAQPVERFKEVYVLISNIFSYSNIAPESRLFPSFIECLDKHFWENKIEMILTGHNNNSYLEKQMIQHLCKKELDGAIIFWSGEENNIPVYKDLVSKLSKTVFIDRIIPTLDVNFVVTDNNKASFEMAECIYKKNIKRIYYISYPGNKLSSGKDRQKGVMEATEKYNIELVCPGDISSSYDNYLLSLNKYFSSLKDDNFAIFANNAINLDDFYNHVNFDFNSVNWTFATFEKPIQKYCENYIWAEQDTDQMAKKVIEILLSDSNELIQSYIPAKINKNGFYN